MKNLAQALAEKRVIVVCGTGGVGKTSVSAALAVAAAQLGRKICLITIDPAKRLASALGLSNLDAKPRAIDAALTRDLGKPLPGRISALMFDPKSTLDNFVEATGGRDLLKEMRANNIYQVIAENFSGTHEYLALDKLHELEASGDYDLIVLDTPPARHTLDFLDAPDKIAAFFDDRIFQWFLTDPRSKGLFERIRAGGTKAAFALLEKVTGEGVLRDFMRLAPHLYTLKRAFVERQSAIRDVLTSEASGALFVATGLSLPQRDFHQFWTDAVRRDLRPLGLAVNRSLAHLALVPASAATTGASTSAPPLVRENYAKIRLLVEAEDANILAARAELGSKYPVVRIPELSQDIERIQAVLEMARYLLPERYEPTHSQA